MSDLEKWVIRSFKFAGDYVIELTFTDGKQQTIDFEPVIGKGWMASLKDLAYFRSVKLNEGGNLEWPDGQDFNPEALYDWPKFEQAYIDDMKSM
ncbi:MAG TPA: DUF2442 domain-containing protein [Dyella sp.]|uniref:DUF2442 domain-containing protein n=1 Tax=Dyella sp. TaxID=1869338 RepID=UPI002C45F0AD|nr:DUF2442 domain-containing protein [Dyella sp.]HUB88287.1 DUF2442 domain-containing protein [Dyella sp.]